MSMEFRCVRSSRIVALVLIASLAADPSQAVTSKITRQSSHKELAAGKTESVVINSRGAIQLGRGAKVLADGFADVWSVNSIVVSGGTIYLGTSPNGSIYQYRLGTLTKIYPAEGNAAAAAGPPSPSAEAASDDANSPDRKDQGKVIEADEPISNEHIFAMAVDVTGRLIVGISGDDCRLCRYETGKMETLFKPDDAKYIFAVAVDNVGNLYLGTGPEGKIYVLDPSGKVAQLVYDSPDKNILSLVAGQDGFVYAGSDTRGLVYKINPRNKSASVLYDSEEPEISALLFAGGSLSEAGYLYAAATSAQVVQTERRFAAEQSASAGRPESRAEPGRSDPASEGGLRLKIANTSSPAESKPAARPTPVARGAKPGQASHIVKISKQGYVTTLFTEGLVFLALAEQNGNILVGSGNEGKLFAIDPATENQTIIYEDRHAAQITAITPSADELYIGTANPARLVLLSPNYATRGTYVSDLLDAGQPARWGKLQIDADIPRGCKVLVASRSGNVKDINDPTFSDWTELAEIIEPIQLRCPLGRFCQYKLVLESEGGKTTPVIREVAVASTVPNLAPTIESVEATRLSSSGKEGVFKITYKATDENDDKLVYKIDFRRVGRDNWIELKDMTESESYEWDGKTVEDGRYEVRVTADDRRSNTPSTRLTGTRISDPIVVDNTGPVIRKYSLEKTGKAATLKLQVTDELSVIGKLEYTINSSTEWKSTLPDDFIFDTTEESFTILTEDLAPGEHVIALKISDDVGNTTYRTYEVTVLGN
jgi:outer membrane protein assembly factor BamB